MATVLIKLAILAVCAGLMAFFKNAWGAWRARQGLKRLGAALEEGSSRLPHPPSEALIACTPTPKWSARLEYEGLHTFAYPLANDHVVTTWWSVAERPIRFVIRNPPDVGNAKHPELAPLDLTGAFVYGAPAPEVQALLDGPWRPLFDAFREQTRGRQGWTFVYDEGRCHLVRYLTMEPMKRQLELAVALEDAIEEGLATRLAA